MHISSSSKNLFACFFGDESQFMPSGKQVE
jgi:hypothetical protein